MGLAQQPSGIGTGATTLYTSTGTTTTTAVYFMNDHTSTVTLQIHLVINGGTLSTNNKIIKDLELASGDTYVLDVERLVLGNGDSIQATADVAGVVYTTVSFMGI